jgi:hypothetical protein
LNNIPKLFYWVFDLMMKSEGKLMLYSKTKLYIIIFSLSVLTSAQSDSSKGIWLPNAVIGLNVSQIALSNWSQGGDNNLTWTLLGTSRIRYLGKDWTFRNSLKIAYGRTKLGHEDFRTNDNEIYLESVISKNIGWAVDPFFSNTIKTSVTKGYNYRRTPPLETADFFDPGYVTQSLGFTYDQFAKFNTRLGFAVQEIFTNKHRQYADKPETEKLEWFKVETGIEFVTKFDFTIDINLYARSTLRLFSRFESLDVWDLRWDNAIVAKVNNYINVNLTFLIIYEKEQSSRTQMKQALQLGLIFTII